MISSAILDQLRQEPQGIPADVAAGEVSVLSVGRGDVRVSFDSDDPEEVEQARKTVTDMLARGYLLFAEVDGQLVRVQAFDAKTDEYVLQIDKSTRLAGAEKKEQKQRIPARRTRATGVAPTAGG